MTKRIELSIICYDKFFKPLNDIYKWSIVIGSGIDSSKKAYISIVTEEPILKEIRAAMETQIAYSKEILKLIKKSY